MAPLGFTPPPRGGHAIAPRIPKPKAPRVIRPKAPDPNKIASDNAMSAFRTALAQLQASTPQVDAAAIRAPYAASQQITGQLGAGYQAAEQRAGQAAQAQYAQGRDAAQQRAAQFGISAGAGANPTQLADNGTQALAQQTAAYQAAAPAATAQWQALLERTAGARVSAAELARAQGLTSAEQSLSAGIPSAIANEKNRLFQAHTQRFNEGLARTQLTQKQQDSMRNYGLDVAKVQQSGQVAQTRAQQNAAAINERKRHDLATETTAQANTAIRQRATRATNKGLKGIPAALKALQGTTAGGNTTKVAKGWDVQVQPIGADGNPLGPVVKQHGPRKDWSPPGYRNVGGATTHYATGPGTPSKTGITPSQWDAQMRGLLAQNPGQAQAIKAFLGPRPKK